MLNFPNGPTGVSWYQFDVTGGNFPATPVQQQEWTNGDDGLWRWMPSIAVDQAATRPSAIPRRALASSPEFVMLDVLSPIRQVTSPKGKLPCSTAVGKQTTIRPLGRLHHDQHRSRPMA